MAFVRYKSITSSNGTKHIYLYIVKNKWTEKGPRQKVIKYLGRSEMGSITRETVKAVYERDKYKCQKCGQDFDLAVDHIKSPMDGGTSEIDNLQILCRTCNSAKGRKMIDYRNSFRPHKSDN